MSSSPAQDTCLSCGEPIYWLKHQRTQNSAPIEVRRDPTGNILVQLDNGTYCVANASERVTYSAHLHVNHFARCLNAQAHHKPRPKTPATATATATAQRKEETP